MAGSNKEISDYLCKAVEQIHEGARSFVLQNMAFLVIMGGWVVASDSGRQFFSSWGTKAIAVAGMAGYAGIYVAVVSGFSRRSRLAFDHLAGLGHIPARYLEPQRISRGMWRTMTWGHPAVALIICLFVVYST